MLKTQIAISDLKPGMTVLFNGKVTTVNKSDLSYDSFMGCKFKGSCHPKYITAVQFEVPIRNGFRVI